MSTTLVRLRKAALAGAAAAALLTASACGSDDIADKVAEKVAEANGAGDVDIDTDNGEFSMTTEDGSVKSGTSMPDGFPEAVPVVDGTVINGTVTTTPEGQAWVVLIEADGSVAEVTEQVKSALTDAGFENISTTTSSEMSILGFQSEEYTVAVQVLDSDGTQVSYTVTDQVS